jgi:hypothetical protein
MKCVEIHNAFNQKEIRDFLAKAERHVIHGDPKFIEAQIAALEKELEKARTGLAANQLLKVMGWQSFDVSDDVQDFGPGRYFSFIGTQSEYDELMSMIKAGK